MVKVGHKGREGLGEFSTECLGFNYGIHLNWRDRTEMVPFQDNHGCSEGARSIDLRVCLSRSVDCQLGRCQVPWLGTRGKGPSLNRPLGFDLAFLPVRQHNSLVLMQKCRMNSLAMKTCCLTRRTNRRGDGSEMILPWRQVRSRQPDTRKTTAPNPAFGVGTSRYTVSDLHIAVCLSFVCVH